MVLVPSSEGKSLDTPYEFYYMAGLSIGLIFLLILRETIFLDTSNVFFLEVDRILNVC